MFICMKYLLVSLCAVFFLFCNDIPNDDMVISESRIADRSSHIVNILFKNNVNDYSDSIIKSVRYIKLETKPESLLGYISDIKFVDDIIIVSDFHKEKQVYLYDKNGKFITEISRKGHASNEYYNLTDLTVDTKLKIIYILDGDQGILLLFDFKGDFIKNHKLPFMFSNNLISVNDSIMLFNCGFRSSEYNSEETYNLFKYNINTGKVVDKYFRYNYQQIKNFAKSECFSKTDSSVYYWAEMDTRALELGDDSLTVKYEICGEFTKYPANFKSMKLSKALEEATNKNYVQIGNYLEFKNWHFVRADSPVSSYLTFTNKSSNISYWDLSYIYGNKIKILPNIMKVNDTMACSWMDARNVGKLNMFDDEIGDVSEYDNPIIVVYELK